MPATNYRFRFFFYRELVPALISITDIAILSIVLIIYYLLKLVNQILLSRGYPSQCDLEDRQHRNVQVQFGGW